jgi:hypothetical protein
MAFARYADLGLPGTSSFHQQVFSGKMQSGQTVCGSKGLMGGSHICC